MVKKRQQTDNSLAIVAIVAIIAIMILIMNSGEIFFSEQLTAQRSILEKPIIKPINKGIKPVFSDISFYGFGKEDPYYECEEIEDPELQSNCIWAVCEADPYCQNGGGLGPVYPCFNQVKHDIAVRTGDWSGDAGSHYFDVECSPKIRVGSRDCPGYPSQVGCDNSCVQYNPGWMPWWVYSSSNGPGQAHCAPSGPSCSPHCGCAVVEEYCGQPGGLSGSCSSCTNGRCYPPTDEEIFERSDGRGVGPADACACFCNTNSVWDNLGNGWNPGQGCLQDTYDAPSMTGNWQNGWWQSDYVLDYYGSDYHCDFFCGDGEAKPGDINTKEECDKGLSLDPSEGITPGATDLRGRSCTSFGYDDGSLDCNSNCAFDTSDCTSAPSTTKCLCFWNWANGYDGSSRCDAGYCTIGYCGGLYCQDFCDMYSSTTSCSGKCYWCDSSAYGEYGSCETYAGGGYYPGC